MVSFMLWVFHYKKKKFGSLIKAPERQLCCLPLVLASISGKDPRESEMIWDGEALKWKDLGCIHQLVLNGGEERTS